MKASFRNIFVFSIFLTASIAFANDDNFGDSVPNMNERLRRMESDLQIMQKQFYRSSTSSDIGAKSRASGLDVDGANIESRVMFIEEQMRELNGKLEENQFLVKQLGERLDILSNDIEYRLGQKKTVEAAQEKIHPAENKEMSISEAAKSTKSAPIAADKDGKTEYAKERPLNEQIKTTNSSADSLPKSSSIKAEAIDGGEEEKPAKPAEDPKKVTYDKALFYIQKSQLAEAERLLEDFIAKYPDDPLTSNAYFWYGEIFYTKKSYEKSAIQYLKGYKKFPKGNKASESLLKLAMSLSNLKKAKESCSTLDKLYDRFPDMSASIRTKADREYKRAGCK